MKNKKNNTMQNIIVDLMLNGHSNAEIAGIVGCSTDKVYDIVSKFGEDVAMENGRTPVFSEEQILAIKLMILGVFGRTSTNRRSGIKSALIKEADKL